jgi:hypothetical protein
MPHCIPQNGQCVGISLTASSVVDQPLVDD